MTNTVGILHGGATAVHTVCDIDELVFVLLYLVGTIFTTDRG